MLPLAWICIALVVCLYVLLFCLEVRARAKRHVRGCPSLPYISRARLDSFIVIEPDLIIVELVERVDSRGKAQIPDARRVAVPELYAFLANSPQRSVFVFYTSASETIPWRQVERIVDRLAIPNVYVLKGGLEGWLLKHPADGMAIA
jgi:hypothetical protein